MIKHTADEAARSFFFNGKLVKVHVSDGRNPIIFHEDAFGGGTAELFAAALRQLRNNILSEEEKEGCVIEEDGKTVVLKITPEAFARIKESIVERPKGRDR